MIRGRGVTMNGPSGGGVETCTISFDDSNNPGGETSIDEINVPCKYLEYNGGKYNITDPPMRVSASDHLNNVVVNSTIGPMSSTNIIIEDGENLRVENRDYFRVLGDATIKFAAPCFVKGTLISLANGSAKPVQDIAYDDDLLVWDFDNGCYASAKPLWIKVPHVQTYYYQCKFENGIVLNLVGSNGKCHRVFNADHNLFEHATDCVGNYIMTEHGVTKLISCERIDEPVEYYNIITTHHINLYANSVLTSCRLNNLYPIHDMCFVKENRQYIPIEVYDNICTAFYDGLRLCEHKPKEIPEINDYVHFLYSIMKPKMNNDINIL